MAPLIIVVALVLIAALAPRFGVDSRPIDPRSL